MVTIRLFGMTKSLAGNQDSLSLALGNGRRVKDLLELINAGYPLIGELIHKKKVLVSVNQEIAHEETDIRDGDEVALLPPFAGGAPQDVETGRQLRSRVAQSLNGDPAASPLGGAHRRGASYSSDRAPQRVRLTSLLAAALLGTKRVSAR